MEKIIYPHLPNDYGAIPAQSAPTGIPPQDLPVPLKPLVHTPPEEIPLTDEEIEDGLPKPCGYKLLLALPDVEDKFEGTSIVKVSSTLEAEQVTSVVALVIDMGDMAYDDKARFPKGPWCKVGDYVLIRPYQGTRFMFNGREYRMVSDDSIEGIVKDPKNYRRV